MPASNPARQSSAPPTAGARAGEAALAERLRRETDSEVLFDAFSRGRYSTDASYFQIEPVGVVVPRTAEAAAAAIGIAREEGVPVLPRGAGTSQCGQTVGEALVVDVSKYLNGIVALDHASRRVTVEPGIVLDRLNASLKPHGLMFPVDVSTSSRATIGGMAGNNSCGARSIRYGTMRDNVHAIDAILADGEAFRFGPVATLREVNDRRSPCFALIDRLLELGSREAAEIAARFPKLRRRVGGYNIDALTPDGGSGRGGADAPNLAHLLVGSEGTLALSTRIELDLQPIPAHKVLGICHFPTFYAAMDATRHIVELDPAAVELVDRTMIDLSRANPEFRPTVDAFVRGEPEALLLVEFAGDERPPQLRGLKRLVELMGSLGYPDAVVKATDPAFQQAIWAVRRAGLNIIMSMKGDGKPISFIEDCAVPLEHLAEYTDRLTAVFERHGTTGTWYAHASEGCLHVRPILNLKLEADAAKMRAIAEEAFAMVREFKGSHSGEHGDGLTRSEFHEAMFGKRMVGLFEDVKDGFDPGGLFNPGKIVRPPAMDDRGLFRYKPGYAAPALDTALDWSDWGGFAAAAEMCNNNGACRKDGPGVMCPSFRVTGDETHLTRGRANSLRLALSGQLGPGALTSDDMAETMKLCVGCKGCRRECPVGVDVARMKIEFLYHYRKRHRLSLRDRLVAYLPRYAPYVSRLGGLANLRDRVPGLARLSQALFGFAAARPLPTWRRDVFRGDRPETGSAGGTEVVLLADTFNTYFEPENLRAARAVLQAGGYRVHVPAPRGGGRPLCCGRTFLAHGLVDQAREEATRLLDALVPYAGRGVPVVGLEPSCLLTLRDEYTVLTGLTNAGAVADRAVLFEEFLAAEHESGKLRIELEPRNDRRALLHGHCHQKAFGAMNATETVLGLVPGLAVETIESGCCGMAGAFGYEAESHGLSMKMGELALLPAVRAAEDDAIIVADGTSCRQQIRDGAGRRAVHVARVLEAALGTANGGQGADRA